MRRGFRARTLHLITATPEEWWISVYVCDSDGVFHGDCCRIYRWNVSKCGHLFAGGELSGRLRLCGRDVGTGGDLGGASVVCDDDNCLPGIIQRQHGCGDCLCYALGGEL